MRKRNIVPLAVAAVAAVILPLGGAAAKPKPPPKTVHVTLKDSYYSPSTIKQKVGGKVQWKWSNVNTQTHNVTLETAPKGVNKKHFRSSDASSHFSFTKKFTVPGKYHFECTIHPTTMQMDLTVKK